MAQADTIPSRADDSDPLETAEWLESLRSVLENQGPERVSFLLHELSEAAHREGVELPFTATTPYINTIPADKQPPYPGNRELERRIKSIIRWNAMAMVTRANQAHDGIGGHISTYRLGRHACTKWPSTTSSAARATTTRATRFTSRGTPRRASTPGRFWKAGSTKSTW